MEAIILSIALLIGEVSIVEAANQVQSGSSSSRRCNSNSPSGFPPNNAGQTPMAFKRSEDGTKYNYNEVLHKSILFYEAQRSGNLPVTNRIPWRGDSGLKDGCDVGIDATGGWYNAGDFVKFNFPMASSLTVLSWGSIVFRSAYVDADELENMINTVKWGTEYFIKCHISRYELVGQVGHGKTDHDNWGRPEEMSMIRPTYTISSRNPGSELAAEVAAALAASSIFLHDSDVELSKSALRHSEELLEFAEKYKGTYHESIPDAASYYKSYSGYEDELLWASAWLYKATKNSTYLEMAKEKFGKIREQFVAEEHFSWDSKFIGAQALMAEITAEATYKNALTAYLDGLGKTKTTRDGLYYLSDHGPNRYAGNAAFLCLVSATFDPSLPKKESYLKWAEKQVHLLLGDLGRSYVIGFGKNYPKSSHHRASSCGPFPQKCDWSTYHLKTPNHYILYGGLVGGPDKNGMFNDKRDSHQQNQVACNFNAGFQSAVAGLKYFAMKTMQASSAVTTTASATVPTPAPTTPSPAERLRCASSTPSGRPVSNAGQTVPNFKANYDGAKYNYNEVLHKSILFYESQRAGKLPRKNRIPWRGDSSLMDGCDVGVDLSGGWYDGGDFVKFGLPLAFSVTTLSWGAILFRDAYEDANELQNMVDCVEWPTRYLIKAHVSTYELVGQIGNPETDHSFWGRPEQLGAARKAFKLTADNPGTEVVAETAAALAASSLFLKDHNRPLSIEALQHAMELFEFADKYRASYDVAIPEAANHYGSYSGYHDELIWAALWLYKATNDQRYLTKAILTYNETKEQFTTEVSFTWDSKFIGAQALLSEITGDETYRTAFSQYLDTLEVAKTTPEGLYYYGDWAPNRYTGGAAFMATVGAILSPALPKRGSYLQWARRQIDLLLGDSGRSYVVGFGENYPVMLHHRASSCLPHPTVCDWSTYHSLSGNHYILYGALVGGPRSDGSYKDERQAYEGSQVGLDYNAGFQSAVAGLKFVTALQKKGQWTAPAIPVKSSLTTELANKLRCAVTSRNGLPIYGGIQTPITFKPNNDGTKYNYNEVIHKSLLFYEAQRSGALPSSNRIPWRGHSGLKDGCDVGVDATGGWYDGGDHMKFNFPASFTLTTLAWGGIEFRDAYKDAGEYHHMINCVKWAAEYFIKAHVSKNELIAQVGKEKDDHDYWGRAEEMTMERPTFKITAVRPGTELAAEVAAALAASSLFLGETHKILSQEALEHAKQIFDFADTHRGSYHYVVPAGHYKSYSGYEDELIWAAAWLYRATKEESYLEKASEWYNNRKNVTKSEYSWDYKLIGAEALLGQVTKSEIYRTAFTSFLDGLLNAKTTLQGMYHASNWAPNRYTGGAAFMAIVGSNMQPPLRKGDEYLKWAENQIHMLLGDSGMSHIIGFGEKYPRMAHHRTSSCPPYPLKCDWTTYNSNADNHYVLYGALVGGTDENGIYRDDREAHEGSQVGCDYNAGFQSAVAGLKSAAMQKRLKSGYGANSTVASPVSVGNHFFQILSRKPAPPQQVSMSQPKQIKAEGCALSSPNGSPIVRASQTAIHFKPNNDKTKHNYNEVLHKSILFFEAQRSGRLPSSNRIPWRGDSALKDGCDINVDLSGGWYDAGDFVKFGFPMAFSLTTLAWGGIAFKDAYIDAGEYHHLIEAIKWPTQYLIKAHVSKYEFIGQIGHGKTDHDQWGRPETMSSQRPTYKITKQKPGTDLTAETAAALAAASIFLDKIYPRLAAEALAHARELYEFADKFRGLYHESITDAAEYYKSYSGYDDELIWGAVWLYKATKDEIYLKNATENYKRIHGRYLTEVQYTWDRKLSGAQALLAELTGEDIYRVPLREYLNKLLEANTTEEGLYFHTEWGPNRHTAGSALIAIVGATLNPPFPKRNLYLKWAETQIGLLLGDSGKSYVVGYGNNYPKSPHHRASSRPPYSESCDWSTFNSPKKNHYILYGALVGGPDRNGVFQDKRNVVQQSEVACDYNACFQSAIAGLKHFTIKSKNPSTTATTIEATDILTSQRSLTTPTAGSTTAKPKRRTKRIKCKPKNPRCARALKRRNNARNNAG